MHSVREGLDGVSFVPSDRRFRCASAATRLFHVLKGVALWPLVRSSGSTIRRASASSLLIKAKTSLSIIRSSKDRVSRPCKTERPSSTTLRTAPKEPRQPACGACSRRRRDDAVEAPNLEHQNSNKLK